MTDASTHAPPAVGASRLAGIAALPSLAVIIVAVALAGLEASAAGAVFVESLSKWGSGLSAGDAGQAAIGSSTLMLALALGLGSLRASGTVLAYPRMALVSGVAATILWGLTAGILSLAGDIGVADATTSWGGFRTLGVAALTWTGATVASRFIAARRMLAVLAVATGAFLVIAFVLEFHEGFVVEGHYDPVGIMEDVVGVVASAASFTLAYVLWPLGLRMGETASVSFAGAVGSEWWLVGLPAVIVAGLVVAGWLLPLVRSEAALLLRFIGLGAGGWIGASVLFAFEDPTLDPFFGVPVVLYGGIPSPSGIPFAAAWPTFVAALIVTGSSFLRSVKESPSAWPLWGASQRPMTFGELRVLLAVSAGNTLNRGVRWAGSSRRNVDWSMVPPPPPPSGPSSAGSSSGPTPDDAP